MLGVIYLPKLNRLTPTLESTLFKAVEESGELARAVLKFLPHAAGPRQDVQPFSPAGCLLQDVAGELLDVAQTCVTMIFVLDEYYGIQVDELIGEHLEKLAAKGYGYQQAGRDYRITHDGSFTYLNLPRLELKDVNLLTTVCKIQEELGELTQYLGKHAGASGESRHLNRAEILEGAALELLDVAQCCFTMMYILAECYNVDIGVLVTGHIAKLQRKGYCV